MWYNTCTGSCSQCFHTGYLIHKSCSFTACVCVCGNTDYHGILNRKTNGLGTILGCFGLFPLTYR